MEQKELSTLVVEKKLIYSTSLRRYVTVDFYLPKNISNPSALSLLLINDGQDLEKMHFADMLDKMILSNEMEPVVCAGIHAGKDRKMEYGTANVLDYLQRGAKAKAFEHFVIERLLPFIQENYCIESFHKKAFAGFSLGGLTALDLVWNYPDIFSVAGIFSGSLWWRKKDLANGYNEETDRIMHQQIKMGNYQPGLRFYFTTGSLDETADRNNNGIIDSIDDTLDLITELEKLGYEEGRDMIYLNYEDGKHDVETWGRAMPAFLKWEWGKRKVKQYESIFESC